LFCITFFAAARAGNEAAIDRGQISGRVGDDAEQGFGPVFTSFPLVRHRFAAEFYASFLGFPAQAMVVCVATG
jgi:hypothetical protein